MTDAGIDIVTFTISLDDVEPRVRRRLAVSADCGSDRFHQALNAAMGRLDVHLHESTGSSSHRTGRSSSVGGVV